MVGPPLWKIWTSIGMIIPNIWANKKWQPNHQPARYSITNDIAPCMRSSVGLPSLNGSMLLFTAAAGPLTITSPPHHHHQHKPSSSSSSSSARTIVIMIIIIIIVVVVIIVIVMVIINHQYEPSSILIFITSLLIHRASKGTPTSSAPKTKAAAPPRFAWCKPWWEMVIRESQNGNP